ncbi:hemin ABC transporter substrate-binding protein [uncultured Vibrio sp.]|uniref:heme/hemin ABC transporter substrate-binding protein n=1 Tax=uncultured Vibrio sp. TaxID=114054 RepID=UPI0025E71474|nr:ABC transporter substrate-binding protein [uncultured Vibrio sp.]
MNYRSSSLAVKTLLLATLSSSVASFAVNAEERIISAGSNITELFYALGAEDQLVAVDVTSKSFVKGSDIPQVGYHRQLSAEGLMALNPTRLIGSSEMGPETTLSLLTASDVEVMTLPSDNSLSALHQRIDTIGELTNKQDKSQRLKEQVDQEITQLSEKKLDNKPNVIFLMLSKDRPATAAGTETPVDKIIELSGANNPAAEIIHSYKPLSFEAIINLQPDYILVSDRSWSTFGGQEKILEKLPLLAATPAGQNQRIISVPSSALIGGFGLHSLEVAKDLHHRFSGQ